MNQNDNEITFYENINSDEIIDEEVKGFPGLKYSGEFEIMQCKSNSQELCLMNCKMNVKDIKKMLGCIWKNYEIKWWIRNRFAW